MACSSACRGIVLIVARLLPLSATTIYVYPPFVAPSSLMTNPSAFTETQTGRSNVRVLNDTILPALHLAKAVASGIGIPGIKPMMGAILELATMLSTMQANDDDLYKLETCLTKLITIDLSGGSEDLRL
ncbi:hypothetical protein B0H14DRAFT_3783962 [Mycena olivaceomarginata]|nr:hypothetical protein B0H14DRAFT_3783962 [Mycena olivaceomarginata]